MQSLNFACYIFSCASRYIQIVSRLITETGDTSTETENKNSHNTQIQTCQGHQRLVFQGCKKDVIAHSLKNILKILILKVTMKMIKITIVKKYQTSINIY